MITSHQVAKHRLGLSRNQVSRTLEQAAERLERSARDIRGYAARLNNDPSLDGAESIQILKYIVDHLYNVGNNVPIRELMSAAIEQQECITILAHGSENAVVESDIEPKAGKREPSAKK